MAEQNIKLEEGKRYILKNGEITEPMKKDKNGTNYKFCTISKEGYFSFWLENGKKFSDNIE